MKERTATCPGEYMRVPGAPLSARRRSQKEEDSVLLSSP